MAIVNILIDIFTNYIFLGSIFAIISILVVVILCSKPSDEINFHHSSKPSINKTKTFISNSSTTDNNGENDMSKTAVVEILRANDNTSDNDGKFVYIIKSDSEYEDSEECINTTVMRVVDDKEEEFTFYILQKENGDLLEIEYDGDSCYVVGDKLLYDPDHDEIVGIIGGFTEVYSDRPYEVGDKVLYDIENNEILRIVELAKIEDKK